MAVHLGHAVLGRLLIRGNDPDAEAQVTGRGQWFGRADVVDVGAVTTARGEAWLLL